MRQSRIAAVVTLVLGLSGCAHQPPLPREATAAELLGIEEIVFDLNAKKLTLAPVLQNLASAPFSRQINAAFGFDPKNPPKWMFETTDTAVSAFSPPVAIALDARARELLQRNVEAVLRAMLEQERRHGFHGYVTPAAAASGFHVEIVDGDSAAIVRANCETKRAQISTGFIRRLLERAVASAGSEEITDGKPMGWPTTDESNWPPALTYTIAYWESAAEVEGITLTKTVKQLLRLEARLQTEVAPAIDEALASRDLPSARDTFAEISDEEDATTLEVATKLVEELGVDGAARRAFDEINAEAARIAAAIERDENSRIAREFDQLQTEAQQFMEGMVMDPAMEVLILTRFAQEQYLKALAFIIAHEASHLWVDGCIESKENENRADAYAALVSFELFHNHQSRVRVNSQGFFQLPELPQDDTPITEWIAESLGWSGFDLVAETFGKAGISPDSSHDDFETRSEAVRELYLSLVGSGIRIESSEERTNGR